MFWLLSKITKQLVIVEVTDGLAQNKKVMKYLILQIYEERIDKIQSKLIHTSFNRCFSTKIKQSQTFSEINERDPFVDYYLVHFYPILTIPGSKFIILD